MGVPDKEERAGAHQNGGPTVKRHKRRRAVVFNGGGVAPVAVDECGEVLLLEGDQGVRRWRSIKERSSSEGSYGGKPARRTPGRWGTNVRCSGVDGRVERRGGGGGWFGERWLPFKGVVGDSREGGTTAGMPFGARARGPWLRPAGDTPLFRQWRADAADAWAPASGGRGSEERGASACGPVRRNAEWAEPRGIVVISNYSKSISNEFKPF
jgi:hypothetical protein